MSYKDSYICKLRQKVGHDLLVLPAAGVIVTDENERILMVFNKDFSSWGFPAGYVENDMSTPQAAAQELLEETSISCKLEHLIPCIHTSGDSIHYPNTDLTQPHVLMFTASQWSEAHTKLDEAEIGQRKWFTLQEAKELPLAPREYAKIVAFERYKATNTFQIVELASDTAQTKN